jgi:hypothetical protein
MFNTPPSATSARIPEYNSDWPDTDSEVEVKIVKYRLQLIRIEIITSIRYVAIFRGVVGLLGEEIVVQVCFMLPRFNGAQRYQEPEKSLSMDQVIFCRGDINKILMTDVMMWHSVEGAPTKIINCCRIRGYSMPPASPVNDFDDGWLLRDRHVRTSMFTAPNACLIVPKTFDGELEKWNLFSLVITRRELVI